MRVKARPPMSADARTLRLAHPDFDDAAVAQYLRYLEAFNAAMTNGSLVEATQAGLEASGLTERQRQQLAAAARALLTAHQTATRLEAELLTARQAGPSNPRAARLVENVPKALRRLKDHSELIQQYGATTIDALQRQLSHLAPLFSRESELVKKAT